MEEIQNNKKRISVIIPCFNGEKFIGKALESVFNQTRKADEIIVINDGSTDNSAQKVISYMSSHPELRFINSTKNNGIGTTINQGIINMTGDFFCWLSADDEFLPTKLEEQEKLAQQNPDSVIYTDWSIIDENSNLLQRFKCPNGNQWEFRMKVLRGCNVNFSTILIPKTILDRVGIFSEELHFGEDYDWLLRAIKQKVSFILLEKYLVNYRTHNDMLTKKVIHLASAQDDELRKKWGF